MTHPADAHVPAPWLPDYEHLRDNAYAHGLVTAALVANATRVDDTDRRMARAALAYDLAAGTALTAWFHAMQEDAA